MLERLEELLFDYGFIISKESVLEYKKKFVDKFYKVIVLNTDNIKIEEYTIIETVKNEEHFIISKCILTNITNFIEGDDLKYLKTYLEKEIKSKVRLEKLNKII